jgi:hypothetical protein
MHDTEISKFTKLGLIRTIISPIYQLEHIKNPYNSS